MDNPTLIGFLLFGLLGFMFLFSLGETKMYRRHHRPPHHPHWPPHHQRLAYIVFIVQDVGIVLSPELELTLMTDVTLGHTINLSVIYLDQNGNPMLTTPVPDSPPGWSQDTPATETLVVAADGNSAIATPVAVGTDNIHLTVVVGGVTYAAVLAVAVTEAPQVLTGVSIGAVVV